MRAAVRRRDWSRVTPSVRRSALGSSHVKACFARQTLSGSRECGLSPGAQEIVVVVPRRVPADGHVVLRLVRDRLDGTGQHLVVDGGLHLARGSRPGARPSAHASAAQGSAQPAIHPGRCRVGDAQALASLRYGCCSQARGRGWAPTGHCGPIACMDVRGPPGYAGREHFHTRGEPGLEKPMRGQRSPTVSLPAGAARPMAIRWGRSHPCFVWTDQQQECAYLLRSMSALSLPLQRGPRIRGTCSGASSARRVQSRAAGDGQREQQPRAAARVPHHAGASAPSILLGGPCPAYALLERWQWPHGRAKHNRRLVTEAPCMARGLDQLAAAAQMAIGQPTTPLDPRGPVARATSRPRPCANGRAHPTRARATG